MIGTNMKKLRRYCSEPLENIENYQNAVDDREHMWHCHHRLEVQGQFRNSRELLKRCGMYWHRPASELIFLRHDVHIRLHHKGKIGRNKGSPRSLETRRKIADSNPQKKKVEMKRISDGFNKVFPSQHEAAKWLRENGYPKATQGYISSCCRGITRYSYGAHWSYT